MRLATVTYLVRDYDEAIRWFVDALGFDLVEDAPLPADKRWVRVAPTGTSGPCLLLALASTPDQADAVGRAAGGRVAFFLETSDFEATAARMSAAGVRFREAPRVEDYGTVAVFEDLYGNLWDLIQPRREG